jgi:hypothetical protein
MNDPAIGHYNADKTNKPHIAYLSSCSPNQPYAKIDPKNDSFSSQKEYNCRHEYVCREKLIERYQPAKKRANVGINRG